MRRFQYFIFLLQLLQTKQFISNSEHPFGCCYKCLQIAVSALIQWTSKLSAIYQIVQAKLNQAKHKYNKTNRKRFRIYVQLMNKSKFKPGKTQTQQDKQTENWDIRIHSKIEIDQERIKVKRGKTQNWNIHIVNEEQIKV